MTPHRVLLAAACPRLTQTLPGRLATLGLQVALVGSNPLTGARPVDAGSESAVTESLARRSPFQVLVLAPLALDCRPLPLDDVVESLAACFILIKAAIGIFEQMNIAGRIIALVPGDAAMGHPDAIADSAIAGGILSLFRTVALELKKTPVSANTIMYETQRGEGGLTDIGSGSLDAVAALIHALMPPAARHINGQEIYAMAASDVGRLHP